MNVNEVALFKFTYVNSGQAPDALLTRATYDAQQMFLEPERFEFLTVYDTYPAEDERPEPGTVEILVTAQYHNRPKFLDRFRRKKTGVYN
jgi:hypothetical protein